VQSRDSNSGLLYSKPARYYLSHAAPYFEDSLNKKVKNPKKTWQILKEATVGTIYNPKIEKITVGGKQISDPPIIADEFNKFFTSIGTSISNSVRHIATDPISLISDNPNIANLNLEYIGPGHLC
jgi:hypothetical protein